MDYVTPHTAIKRSEEKPTRIQMAEGLSEFPREVFAFADSLEILDLSNNVLSSLPDDFGQLIELRILFLSNNQFTELPEVLARCPKLEMIGFKSNQIELIPEASLPAQTRWLILTDNHIDVLPESIGGLSRLQKLMLAGNRLTELPASLSHCKNLQLLRISANRLAQFPNVLSKLPSLAWLAFAGNPFCASTDASPSLPKLTADKLTRHELLGQGASGDIYRTSVNDNSIALPQQLAIKVFKGEVTSDGYPEDELKNCLKTGLHPSLVKPLALLDSSTESALIMELIPPHFSNLGLPPSLASCTRDTFAERYRPSIQSIGKIVEQMQSLNIHLNAAKVLHGDLYAHNVLIDNDDNILFGDFGAASCYEALSEQQQQALIKVEQRALGFFIDDLLGVCRGQDRDSDQFKALERVKDSYIN